MISKADQLLLSKKGISAEQVAEQLKTFKTGFPFLKIEDAATIGKGILNPSEKEIEEYLAVWDNYCVAGNAILKFVPASGAASRMFKDLFSFLSAEYNVPTTDFEKNFFANIEKFAFYGDLIDLCVCRDGADHIISVFFHFFNHAALQGGSTCSVCSFTVSAKMKTVKKPSVCAVMRHIFFLYDLLRIFLNGSGEDRDDLRFSGQDPLLEGMRLVLLVRECLQSPVGLLA